MSHFNIFPEKFSLRNGLEWPRLLPAPMEGVMGPLFCKAMMNLNLTDAWLTPFLRLTTGVPRPSVMRRMIEHYIYPDTPAVVQVLAAESRILADFCQRMQKYFNYASESGGVAGINFNFACPSRTVVKSNGGGALLKNIDLMKEMISIVKEACPEWHVDAKIRMGVEDWHEAEKIIPALKKSGTDMLYVHFRTVTDQYKPVENPLERMKLAVELADGLPVYGSGDIFGIPGMELMAEAGCDGVVFGRGLLRDPFLLRRCQGEIAGETNCLPDGEDAKVAFLNEMLNVGKTEPELMSKPALMEMAVWMLGPKHPVFDKLKLSHKRDLFNLVL